MLITKKLYTFNFLKLFFFPKLTFFFTIFVPGMFLEEDILIIQRFFLKFFHIKLKTFSNNSLSKVFFNYKLPVSLSGRYLFGFWPNNAGKTFNKSSLQILNSEKPEFLFLNFVKFILKAQFLQVPFIFFKNIVYDYRRMSLCTKKENFSFDSVGIISFVFSFFKQLFRLLGYIIINYINLTLVLTKLESKAEIA